MIFNPLIHSISDVEPGTSFSLHHLRDCFSANRPCYLGMRLRFKVRLGIIYSLSNKAAVGNKFIIRPGLVVMGDGSVSRGNGFESRRRILDGHFIHIDLL